MFHIVVDISIMDKEYIITYSMDNYIYVDIFRWKTSMKQKSGYLINGVSKSGNNYKYDGINLKKMIKKF